MKPLVQCPNDRRSAASAASGASPLQRQVRGRTRLAPLEERANRLERQWGARARTALDAHEGAGHEKGHRRCSPAGSFEGGAGSSRGREEPARAPKVAEPWSASLRHGAYRPRKRGETPACETAKERRTRKAKQAACRATAMRTTDAKRDPLTKRRSAANAVSPLQRLVRGRTRLVWLVEQRARVGRRQRRLTGTTRDAHDGDGCERGHRRCSPTGWLKRGAGGSPGGNVVARAPQVQNPGRYPEL